MPINTSSTYHYGPNSTATMSLDQGPEYVADSTDDGEQLGQRMLEVADATSHNVAGILDTSPEKNDIHYQMAMDGRRGTLDAWKKSNTERSTLAREINADRADFAGRVIERSSHEIGKRDYIIAFQNRVIDILLSSNAGANTRPDTREFGVKMGK